MSLTALEIKQRTFAKSLRGYDVAEVNAFLSMIANEWEHKVGKLKDLERDLKQINDKLAHYQRIEATLHETLQTARDNAAQKLENARQDAENKIEKAEMEAEQIVSEARKQRQDIKQSISKLLDRREEIISGMTSYLDMAQKSLDNFRKDDSGIFKLPADEHESGSKSETSGKTKSKPKPKSKKAAKETASVPGAEDLDDLIDEID